MINNQEKLELELAYLIRHLPQDLLNKKSVKIRQGYLLSDDPAVKDIRIREKEGNYTYTVKTFVKSSKETGYNKEETRQLTENEFNKFWKEAVKKIRKVRYLYPLFGGLTAEIDIYKDNLEGLNVVEVEFPSIETYKAFKKPEWFGKEVTDSKGIYPPYIANLNIDRVNSINNKYKQKPHKFE